MQFDRADFLRVKVSSDCGDSEGSNSPAVLHDENLGIL
jgi:hypothetical protein